MNNIIQVTSENGETNLWAKNGIVHVSSLRTAFFLNEDTKVCLYQRMNGTEFALPCQSGSFELMDGFDNSTFHIEIGKQKETAKQPEPSNQQPKNYEIVKICQKYMLHSKLELMQDGSFQNGNSKSCVTVASAEFAFMAGHCLPQSIQRGVLFNIYDYLGKPYEVKLIFIDQNENSDIAILEAISEKFQNYPIGLSYPNIGDNYFVLGYDGDYSDSETLSVFRGAFRNCTIRIDRTIMIGSSGTTSGCSGGGVFNNEGELYGIVCGGKLSTIGAQLPLVMHIELLERKLGEPSFSHIVPALYLSGKLKELQF